MIETQRQRLLASSFGDQRSRQVGHDHINYWNFSTGMSGEKKLGHQSLKESYTFSLYSCLCVLKFRRTNDDSDKNVHFNSNIQKVVLGRYFSQCFRALLMLFQVISQIRHNYTKIKEKITFVLFLLIIQSELLVWRFVICSTRDTYCIMIDVFYEVSRPKCSLPWLVA